MTTPAIAAVRAAGIPHRIVTPGAVSSLNEAAAALHMEPRDLVKSLVVRRGEGDHLFVLVGGDRQIAWPALRTLLGVSRLSLPDATTALAVTGYERGTITPFGSATALPLVLDAHLQGRTILVGAGQRGTALVLNADDLVAHFAAAVADVTQPPPPRDPTQGGS